MPDDRQDAARILCRTGRNAGATHDLPDDATVGRAEDNDIIVGSQHMSRRHARIWFDDGTWWIEDLGSRNGTRVDGSPVREAMPLRRLHVITFADEVDFIFVRSAALEGASEGGAGRAAPRGRTAERREEARAAGPDTGEGEREHRPTVADLSAFGELPDLDERPGRDEPAERKAPAPPPDEREHKATVADMSAFGQLPDLEEEPEAPTPAEPAAAEPPPEPQPGDERQHRATVADMSAFGQLPDLEEESDLPDPEPEADEREAATPEPGPPAGARPETVSWGVRVELPGRGATTLPLRPGENTLGRSETCDIPLPDPEKVLSRRHVLLHVEGDRVTLADLGSANGTWIDGERVDRTDLEVGDRFTLGPNLEFELVRNA